MAFYSSEHIPYIEFGVINQLVREHPDAHENKLRAMIVFGSLVASGSPYDLNLLEVVEDWEGPRHVIFTSTEALPLRGRLELYFLTPEEFEHPTNQPVPGKGWSSADLLARVRNAYTIVTENPSYYASETMARYDDAVSPSDTEVSPGDPISFLKQAHVAVCQRERPAFQTQKRLRAPSIRRLSVIWQMQNCFAKQTDRRHPLHPQ